MEAKSISYIKIKHLYAYLFVARLYAFVLKTAADGSPWLL